jgi:hypothetical protein
MVSGAVSPLSACVKTIIQVPTRLRATAMPMRRDNAYADLIGNRIAAKAVLRTGSLDIYSTHVVREVCIFFV